MKYLKHAKLTAPKFIYQTTLDHSADDLAKMHDDQSWRMLITLGDTVAIDHWGKFVRSNFTGAVPKFAEIITESQTRTGSNEVYYTVEVTNKKVTLQYFVE